MKLFSNLSIRARITLACLVLGLIPLSVLTLVTWRAANRLAEVNAQQFGAVASDISDKIDRNLFERYGDVQAFGVNSVVQNKETWGQTGQDNPIVQAMNRYIDLYDVYYFTLLVDLEGKVIAVNSKDNDGKPINTESLYKWNFSDESWFQDAVNEKFSASEDGTLTGTVVQDLYVDEDVQEIYGDEGLALAFTAPVRDANGEIIAVWRNVTKFGIVEEIITSYYATLKDRGLASAELTLLDKAGNVIVDYDPTSKGSDKLSAT